MSNKFLSSSTTTIEFEDGDFIEFYLEIPWEDQLEASTEESLAKAGFQRLFSLAKKWNLKDENNEEVPLTRENFMRLSTNLLVLLLQEMNKRIKEHSDSFRIKKK